MREDNKLTFFTPGPAQLYPTVEEHYKNAFNQNIGSISHRSAMFRKIYQHTDEQLKELLGVPKENAILFTSSATEVWERLIMNLVEFETYHLVNGSFSSKFYDFAKKLSKVANQFEKKFGEGFDAIECEVPEFSELIACCANETSAGVQMKADQIHRLKKANKNKFLAVDMVSSAPYVNLDYSLVDTAYFSVQKAFGMPAGLGIWIANEAMLERANQLKAKGQAIGTYHSLPALWKNYQNYETPETPNVMAIYVLGKVAEDLNKIGIAKIRRETERKARLLYEFAMNSDQFDVFVENPDHRSNTVIVLNSKENSANLIKRIKDEYQMVIGSGYGAYKESQIRIANFPAVNVDEVQALIQVLQ